MLKITLYQGYRFNNSYQNVFGGNYYESGNTISTLEKYLNSLTKFNFTLNNVYYESNGEFVVDMFLFTPVKFIYDYNYLKVEFIDDENNTKKFTRYCFINEIILKNGCVYIEYEEDIWHSYFNSILGINKSFLTASRLKSYTNFTPSLLELPVKYNGNNKLVIQDLKSNHSLYCLVQIQLYDLVGYNEKGVRTTKYFLIRKTGSPLYYHNITTIQQILADLMRYMTGGVINAFYYDVGNIYLLNYSLLFDFSDITFGTETEIIDNSGSSAVGTGLYVKEFIVNDDVLDGVEICNGTIQNDYKNLSFGTIDKQISIINNGTDIDYSVVLYLTQPNICIQLRALNQIVDITESFKFVMPVNSITSSEWYQRVLSESLKVFNTDVESEMKNTKSIAGFGQAAFDFLGIFGANTFGSISKAIGGLVSSVFGVKGVGGGEQDLYQAKKFTITEPQYTTSKGVFNVSSPIANYTAGLVRIEINPDNTDYVKETINNFGYIVYEYLSDLNKLDLNKTYYSVPSVHYNVIKFSYIDLYGKFPRNIAEKLEQIFTNGVKVWYDYNLAEDNYVV